MIGEVPDAEHIRRQVRGLHPDVVMLSTSLAGRDLEGTIAAIRAASPATSVLAIAGAGESSEQLIAAGSSGVIHRGLEADAIAQSVISVAGGSQIVIARDDEPSAGEPVGLLTPRELSILALIAAGDTNAQIGDSLFIATKTVERHVATIIRKLGRPEPGSRDGGRRHARHCAAARAPP